MIHCEKEAEISVLKTQYSFVVSELKEIKVSLRDFIDASDKKYSTTENNNFLDKRVSRLEKYFIFRNNYCHMNYRHSPYKIDWSYRNSKSLIVFNNPEKKGVVFFIITNL